MRRQIAVDLAAAFVLSLLGGYCFAYLWRATAFATKRADGHHLYFRAALCGSLRKVYIGLVAAIPMPTPEPAAVPLFPFFSGNRDTEGRLILTTDYDAVYSTLRAGRAAQLGLPVDWESQLRLLIRADEIIAVALFSAAIYAEFKPAWQQHIVEPKNQPQVVQVLSSMGTNFRFSGPM